MKFTQHKSIAIVGDIILDEFVFGSVRRINPEAPVPILHIKERQTRLGGSANVAHNIVALDGDCLLVGKVGPEREINSLLDEKGIQHRLLVENNAKTIKKTRFIANNQQLMRVDDEEISFLKTEQVQEVVEAVKDIDIIVIVDYGKGMITPELMDALRGLQKKILVDPKDIRKELFRDVFLIKPNLEETKKSLKMEIQSDEDLEKAAQTLQRDYNAHVLITRSEKGMSLFEWGKDQVLIRTQAKEVYDVTGAGDTVIATIALALASDLSLRRSVELANQAAGIAVGKLGTATVSSQELFSYGKEDSKIKNREELAAIVEKLKQQGKDIVFTNGCFDLLHVGHARLLQKAKSFGDLLILGLNTDDSIRRLKGSQRPIVSQDDRAELLASLDCVDYIVFFEEDDPGSLIALFQPTVHVKGGDYDPNNYESMPEAKIVHGYGGRVEVVNLVAGKSTSNIVSRIQESS